MQKLFSISLMLVGTALGGCSTVINGTAPAKEPDSVYAVGAKQGFFVWHQAVWKCSTVPGKPKDCEEVEVGK